MLELAPPTANAALLAWVRLVAGHVTPDRICWCIGSKAEQEELMSTAMAPRSNVLTRLDASTPTAGGAAPRRVLTATSNPMDAGPANRWLSPDDARTRMWPRFGGAMRGRTMYVVPYVIGPSDAKFSGIGVSITDSPHIAHSIALTARVGRPALDQLGNSKNFVCGVHSLGDLSPEQRFVIHLPETAEVWSLGSGEALDALLTEPCQALRVASARAKEGGWLAENMSLLELNGPDGPPHYFTIATLNEADKAWLGAETLARAGWKLTVRSRLTWMRAGVDGRLWALNPEWPGACWPSSVMPAARARAKRYPFRHGPASRNDPKPGLAAGPVPLSAIVFSGCQPRSVPLVYEARSWRHGVYVGATLVGRADGSSTSVLHDPMAMRAFCAYNLGDYLNHWLSVGRTLAQPPGIFHLNLARAKDGKVLWPSGSENLRLFKWMVERVDGEAFAHSTALGYVPTQASLDVAGLQMAPDALTHLLSTNPTALLREADSALMFLGQFRQRLPPPILTEHGRLIRRLQDSVQ